MMYMWTWRIYPEDKYVVVKARSLERARAKVKWELKSYKYRDLWLVDKHPVEEEGLV